MAVEKNLLTNNFASLVDAAGEYITVTEDYSVPLTTRGQPLVTPNSGLLSRDRHVHQSSTGNTVIARASARTARRSAAGVLAALTCRPAYL